MRLVSILAKDHFIVQFSLQFFFVFLSSFFLSYPSSDSPDIHKKVKQRKPSLSLNHYQISTVFFHHKCLGTTTTCTCSDYYVIISLSFSTTPTSSPHKEHKRKFRGSLSFSKSLTILHSNLPFHSSLCLHSSLPHCPFHRILHFSQCQSLSFSSNRQVHCSMYFCRNST